MNHRSLPTLITACLLLTSCQNFDPSLLIQSGLTAFQATSINDDQVKAMSISSCAEMDRKEKIASTSSKYNRRLQTIAATLGNNINGTPLNYKAYLTKEVNAWAMANGCIRVYSGLMDIMTDDEIRAVVAHEIGHVALGHVRKAMEVAYATEAARMALASAGGIIGQLSASQLASVGEKLITSKFSRTEETQADEFSFYVLKRRGINPRALLTSLQKLEKLPGAQRQSSLFDDHPSTEARITHIEQLLSQR